MEFQQVTSSSIYYTLLYYHGGENVISRPFLLKLINCEYTEKFHKFAKEVRYTKYFWLSKHIS